MVGNTAHLTTPVLAVSDKSSSSSVGYSDSAQFLLMNSEDKKSLWCALFRSLTFYLLKAPSSPYSSLGLLRESRITFKTVYISFGQMEVTSVISLPTWGWPAGQRISKFLSFISLIR